MKIRTDVQDVITIEKGKVVGYQREAPIKASVRAQRSWPPREPRTIPPALPTSQSRELDLEEARHQAVLGGFAPPRNLDEASYNRTFLPELHIPERGMRIA